MLKFSIIIPVRAINDYMRESIPEILQIDYPDYEIIIITDEPESSELVNDPHIIMLSSGKVGPGEKRNIGAKAATGDILAFLDDDAFPASNWLNVAAKYFEDKKLYALGGPAITPLSAGILEVCSGHVFSSYLASGSETYRYIPQDEREIVDCASVNLFVRKNAFDSVGGFVTDFWPGEDTKLCLDLLNKYGRKFIYTPELIVYHHRRNLFLPHLKQVSRYGKHRGQFARIFPETSRMPVYFIPSLFVMGLLLGGFVSLLSHTLRNIYFFTLSLYTLLVFAESVRSSIKEKSVTVGALVFLGIFLTHIVYGYNFIVGYMVRPKLKLKRFDSQTGNYTEG